jgi:putative transposase
MNVSKSIPSDLLNTLLSEYRKPEDLLGKNGLLKHN